MPIIQLDPRELKDEARALMKTARVDPLRFTALYLAVTVALSLVDTAACYALDDGDFFSNAMSFSFNGTGVMSLSMSFVDVLVMLIGAVLSAGYANYALNVSRGVEMPYESLFDAFAFAGKVILFSLLLGVILAAGLMLFIVPGVILAFCYAFALFHICEEPDVGVIEAMRRSRAEMWGYKWQYLVLLFSFLPLLLLAGVARVACQALISPLLPETLVGDLLYALVSGAVVAAAELYLLPYLTLAQVCFFRRVMAAREGNTAS